MSISPLRIALLGGAGGLMVAWLAAATTAPRVDAPVPAPAPMAPLTAPQEEPSSRAAADLAADLERLRRWLANAPGLRSGARNPFSLAPPPASQPPRTAPAVADPERVLPTVSRPPRPVGPAFTLIGIATTNPEVGAERTGILTAANGEVLLVGRGDRIPGGYLVDAVEPESVTLVDGTGGRHRLDLP